MNYLSIIILESPVLYVGWGSLSPSSSRQMRKHMHARRPFLDDDCALKLGSGDAAVLAPAASL